MYWSSKFFYNIHITYLKGEEFLFSPFFEFFLNASTLRHVCSSNLLFLCMLFSVYVSGALTIYEVWMDGSDDATSVCGGSGYLLVVCLALCF
jgi:hypothetical protein